MMLALLIYSYATGTFSSRAMERQSYDSMAVRHLCANHHPDHDTIAKFRRENGPLLKACFVRVLELAREVGLLKLGTPQRGRPADKDGWSACARRRRFWSSAKSKARNPARSPPRRKDPSSRATTPRRR